MAPTTVLVPSVCLPNLTGQGGGLEYMFTPNWSVKGESAVVVAADDSAEHVIVFSPGAADVTADIEAGPVVDNGRRHHRGW